MNSLTDVDLVAIPDCGLHASGLSSSLTAALHPGQGGTKAKFQSLEWGHGRIAPSVTDANHGSGQATTRVTEHAIALWTTTEPTCRQFTAFSKPPWQAPFYVPDRVDAAQGGATRDIRTVGLRFGHGEFTTTATYVHVGHAQRLDIVEANTPPSIRPGNFHGVEDSLMEFLGGT